LIGKWDGIFIAIGAFHHRFVVCRLRRASVLIPSEHRSHDPERRNARDHSRA
jgi:hypothetical protein